MSGNLIPTWKRPKSSIESKINRSTKFTIPLITEEQVLNEILCRWREYCEELYSYQIQKDERVLDEVVQTDDPREEEEAMTSEVEWAVKELKRNKSPGSDNVSAELIQEGGEATTKIMHKLCNEILRTKKWPSLWTESVLIAIPKKTNSRKCSDYRTISLINPASNVMLMDGLMHEWVQPRPLRPRTR